MSVAMMLRYSGDMEDAAMDIEKAISSVLEKGYRTWDIMQPGMKEIGTEAMGDLIVQSIDN
ncbi:MAG TPA: isocitrate/isopropylmalate family dehydrogenase, partial [Clostridia bacterium]|nr:isocitrate/isopropylmalate family dehydrogenase [Clostridia bacterium]